MAHADALPPIAPYATEPRVVDSLAELLASYKTGYYVQLVPSAGAGAAAAAAAHSLSYSLPPPPPLPPASMATLPQTLLVIVGGRARSVPVGDVFGSSLSALRAAGLTPLFAPGAPLRQHAALLRSGGAAALWSDAALSELLGAPIGSGDRAPPAVESRAMLQVTVVLPSRTFLGRWVGAEM